MSRLTLAERLARGRETEDARRARLVEQAANMRRRQAEKRNEAHVCPPSETDAQLTRLQGVLNRVAPANIAPIPIAMMFEDGQWTVDINVRIRGVTDYEVSGSGESLAHALANAARTLAHQADNERRSTRDARVYGLAY
jgi:hypothetical protein